MKRLIERKVRALLLRYFRDDLRLAYDRGYIAGLEDAGGPAFEDGFEAGAATVNAAENAKRREIFMEGWRKGLASCAAASS